MQKKVANGRQKEYDDKRKQRGKRGEIAVEKPTYRGIDLFKCIAAMMILLLHVPPFASGSTAHLVLRQMITVTAVPFFFAAAGFFAVRRLSADFRQALPGIKRPYLLYLKWSLIYLPFALFSLVLGGKGAGEAVLTYLRNFLLEGSYLTIWFLNALALAFLLSHLLLRLLSPAGCLCVGAVLYLIGCLFSAYHDVLLRLPLGEVLSQGYYGVFESTKNGLLFGFPLVALGGWVAHRVQKGAAVKAGTACIGCAASFAVLCGEVLLRNAFFPHAKSVDFAVSLLPFTLFALQLALSLRLQPRSLRFCAEETDLYALLRQMSILIFLTQRIFIFGVEKANTVLSRWLGITLLSDLPVLSFVLVSSLTVAFSLLLMAAGRRYAQIRNLY